MLISYCKMQSKENSLLFFFLFSLSICLFSLTYWYYKTENFFRMTNLVIAKAACLNIYIVIFYIVWT